MSIFVDIHTGISISKLQTASVLVKPVITKNGGDHKYMHEMNIKLTRVVQFGFQLKVRARELSRILTNHLYVYMPFASY